MKTENLKFNEKESLKEKFKKSMKVNIFQLSLAGILLCVGVLAEGYIRVGYTTFITFSIYLTVGLILPLWLGVATGLLIDLLYLVLIGWIGDWYWTMGLEKVLIVIVGWAGQFFYSLVKSRKLTLILSVSFLLIILVGGTVAFVTKDNQLSQDHILNRGKLETDTQFLERWLKNGFAIAGMLGISIFMILHIIHYVKGTKKSEYLATVLMAIMAAVIVQWLYHPWNVAMWYQYKRGVSSWDHYDVWQISAMISSLFYIGISIPIVTMFWTIYKSSTYFKNKNRF